LDSFYEISFDHDLGGDDTTRPVMLWIIESNFWPEVVAVHSANRVGKDWLIFQAAGASPESTIVLRY
jgi:hypothetical protein